MPVCYRAAIKTRLEQDPIHFSSVTHDAPRCQTPAWSVQTLGCVCLYLYDMLQPARGSISSKGHCPTATCDSTDSTSYADPARV